jgi:hypothetical protein
MQVADKYKQKVHLLANLYAKGKELSTADLDVEEATVSTSRTISKRRRH